MSFPLDMLTEFYVDGQWVPAPTYERDAVTVDYGVPDLANQADPGSLNITVNNRDGRFSPRNPMSPYYGKIGRNTRVRFSVPGSAPYLDLDGSATGIAATPDAAALDITGDLDLRWEGETDWYTGKRTFLIGKWGDTADTRSYALRLTSGGLYLDFVTSTSVSLAGFRSLPVLPRRAALRGTLDVNNGASGFTVRLYWAETIAGPWTQVGADVTSTAYGVISLQATTAPLQIAPDGPAYTPPVYPVAGRVYKAEVRAGIGGTVAASPDFTTLAAGTTSFTDSAGRVWTVSGSAVVRDRHDLFVGEVSEWPQEWTPDSSDAWVTMTGSGILRRMGQGKKALQSALRRRVPSYAPLAYWPMEEGAQATQAYSPIDGVAPLSLTGVDWAAVDTLPSSGPLPTLRSQTDALAMMTGQVPAPASALTAWSVNYLYRLDTPPPTLYTIMRVLSTGGTVREWYLQSRDSQSRVIGRDAEGADVVNVTISTGSDLWNQWILTRFYCVQQTATTVAWRIEWQDVGGDAGGAGDTYTGTIGRPTAVSSPPAGYATGLDGLALGHISVWPAQTTAAYDRAVDAYTGETAWNRMWRLCQEESIPLAAIPSPEDTQRVGPQTPDALLTLLQAAADADGGLLLEDRRWPGLVYRERASMYSQEPKLVLSYSQAPGLGAPLSPVDDDTAVRNDRTVKRDGGSESNAVLETGPLSVQDPPDGIGRYDDSVTLSLHGDAQTEPIAYWRLALGTVDEPRYPTVKVLLHKAPGLIAAVRELDEGDLIRITDLPAFVGYGHVDLLVTGVHHEMRLMQWTASLTCAPASPWRAGIVGDTRLGIVDTDGTELAAAVDAAATILPVTTDGARWVWETDMDVQVGGEVVTVHDITGTPEDRFDRTLASGWGTATTGELWSLTGGTTADYSVAGGTGSVNVTSVNVSRWTVVPYSSPDADLVVGMSTDKLATGGGHFLHLAARLADVNNTYLARVDFNIDQTLTFSIRKRIAGSETVLGTGAGASITELRHAAGRVFWMRFQVIDSTLRAKLWLDGRSEPVPWQITATDTALSTGIAVGMRALLSSANTNGTVAATYRSFQQLSPQLMHVTRSVNGVTKAHTAGTDVRLAEPSTVVL